MPIKVLYFVHTYTEKNGISVHLSNIVSCLPRGIEAEVVCGRGHGLPFFSSLRIPLSESLEALRADFDVMHVHGYGNFFSFFGAIVAAAKNRPLVWTIHGYPQIAGARRLLYFAYRWLMAPLIFAQASRIISVSPEIVPLLKKETGKKILVMPNGVDLDFFRPKSSYKKQKLLCYIGRLDADKGAERLFECRSLPLLFAGPDEDGTRERLRAMARESKIRSSFAEVSFEKMPGVYEKCRYVALPSKYEGFPLTLLEAVAMERPFIGTDVGAVKATLSRLFSNPEKFILEDSMEKKIRELEARDLGRELSRARRMAREYSWTRMAARLAKIYSEACRDRTHGSL